MLLGSVRETVSLRESALVAVTAGTQAVAMALFSSGVDTADSAAAKSTPDPFQPQPRALFVGLGGRSLLWRFVSSARAPVSPGRLRALREQAGLTQHELAQLVGVIGGARVSAWENGRSIPRPETLHNLAAALGVGVAALFDVDPGGAGVRELRLQAGLTMDQLARRVSVSVPTVQRWEYGDFKRLPPVATMDLAARVLGVPRDRVAQAFQVSRDAQS